MSEFRWFAVVGRRRSPIIVRPTRAPFATFLITATGATSGPPTRTSALTTRAAKFTGTTRPATTGTRIATGRWGTSLVAVQGAILVFVQLQKIRRGSLDLIGRQITISVHIQRLDDGGWRRPNSTRSATRGPSVLPTFAAGRSTVFARPWGLRPNVIDQQHTSCQNEQSCNDYASHRTVP